GVVIGALVVFIIVALKKNILPLEVQQKLSDLESENQVLTSKSVALDKEKSVVEVRLEDAARYFNQQKEEIVVLKSENKNLRDDLAISNTNLGNLEEKLTTQKSEMQELQKKFTTEFENIANKILEEKSVKFTAQNKENIDIVLNPLNEKLKSFEEKVQLTYEKGLAERTELKGQIIELSKLNQTLSKDAQNLTKALTYDNKAQGNWGEMILEKILSDSGLTEGEEYTKQFSTTNEEGKRIMPDYIIQLPDSKHIIVDSKVSLVAYNQYISPESHEQKAIALKNHLISVKNHIKFLSEKNYQTGAKLDSPDFVLLFMPIEASFSLAIQNDKELYEYAISRNIVIVSPTTLLATVKTIASIWKQEKQNRNTLEIASQAGALYDKFVGFLEDMEKIERGLSQAESAYQGALNKLQTGKGNLVRRTEKIKELGVSTSKQIPQKFLEE
ncbi:MAG: DNA recombination protein RmuC, partial [Flavobacteriales bacterium]